MKLEKDATNLPEFISCFMEGKNLTNLVFKNLMEICPNMIGNQINQAQKEDKEQNKQIHERNLGERSYLCHYCKAMFATIDNRNDHEVRHCVSARRENQQEEIKERPVVINSNI